MTDRKRGLIKVAVLVALLVGGILLVRGTSLGDFLSREGVTGSIEILRRSPWAPLLFVPVYACAVALAVPGTIPTLVGGAVFGLWWGTVLNWTGAFIGANIAYALARFLGRDGVLQLLGGRAGRLGSAEPLARGVREHGFRGMLTLRLIPVVPFNALNFGAGLVGVSWPAYALATALGIVPGAFVYTMFADALLEGSTEASRDAFLRLALAGALLVLLSLVPTVLKKLKGQGPGGVETRTPPLGSSPADTGL